MINKTSSAHARAYSFLFFSTHAVAFVKLEKVYHELVEFTGKDFSVRVQESLALPSASDKHLILINYKILAYDISVIASLLAHEWQHRMLNHEQTPHACSQASNEQAVKAFMVEFLARYHYALPGFLQPEPVHATTL